jgi:hypothetical protein
MTTPERIQLQCTQEGDRYTEQFYRCDVDVGKPCLNILSVLCAASSSSLTDVSKWLCSFFKAMCPTVNDLWVSKLKKADVPCDSSWILNDSTGVVEVINNLNRSRSEIDKASPLLLQFFSFFNSIH